MARVLHVLSQRPSLTGSGITIDALVRQAEQASWRQHAVVGTPLDDPRPAVGTLAAESVHPLIFERPPLDFPLPGMSDVMPYRSTRFSSMDQAQLKLYREQWSDHLSKVIASTRPDLIHAHHLWLVGSMIKRIAPTIPVVSHCHATGLRQMKLCPQLADEVRQGCAKNDAFLTLHRQDAADVADALAVETSRVHVTGAGYREELFHDRGRRTTDGKQLVYVGKFSASKGLPYLLDAVEQLDEAGESPRLHVVGAGSGDEADQLRQRMQQMPAVVMHGTMSQDQLADLLRACDVFVLPSFYEGLPLVVVEALACGCRPLVTDLPGVGALGEALGDTLIRIPRPPMVGVDTPEPGAMPEFVAEVAGAIRQAQRELPESRERPADLSAFTWQSVFRRVEHVWNDLLGIPPREGC